MTIEELNKQIKSDTVTAMKAGNKVAVDTLRSISNAITVSEKAKNNKAIDPIDLLSSLAKKRRESIDMYDNGGRTDLADSERAELAVIEAYLPKTLSKEEIEAVVAELTDGDFTIKDMGQLVGKFKSMHPGQDMKTVSGMIRAAIM